MTRKTEKTRFWVIIAIIASSLLLTVTPLCLGHSSQAANDSSTPANGAIVAQLEVPRLHISVVVLEGSDPSILAVAAGHIEGTSLPGPSGNVGIAAHRDTFFGSLRKIRPNDIITVETINRNFTYVVNRTEVVAPTDIAVLRQTTDAELTLVTCYPFHHNGPSPKRFIVHATCITNASFWTSVTHKPDSE